MTIKEFCTEYGKSETNVRAKIAHNKDKLKDHVSKSPYTRMITCLLYTSPSPRDTR